MNALLLKNAHLIDPSQGFDGLTDMLIENGHVIDLGPTVHQHPDSTNARHIDIGKQWVLPGLIDTPMAINRRAQERGVPAETIRAERNALVPMGFMGSAWDVANAALFLASDEARYISGVLLPVDGGLLEKRG